MDPARESRSVVRTRFSERKPTVARDGRWLAYVSNESGREEGNGDLMVVPLRAGPELLAGSPRPLFRGDYHYNILANRTYDVAPDGRFLLMMTPPAAQTRDRHVNVVVNWDDDVRRVHVEGRDAPER